MSKEKPKASDVINLDANHTATISHTGDITKAGGGAWTVEDSQGEAFTVVRDPDGDTDSRRAWKLAYPQAWSGMPESPSPEPDKPTPRPWIVDGGTTPQGNLFIHVDDESVKGHTCVATVHGQIQEGAKANAALIVAAVNSFDAMRAALTAVLAEHPAENGRGMDIPQSLLAQINHALAGL